MNATRGWLLLSAALLAVAAMPIMVHVEDRTVLWLAMGGMMVVLLLAGTAHTYVSRLLQRRRESDTVPK